MASGQSKLGRQAFTVQESVNMDCFIDWFYEEMDLSAANDTSTYITSLNPAKKVVLYYKPTGAVSIDSNDILTVTLNGETDAQKLIKIDGGDLPFTITGLLITSLKVATDDHDADESVSVLSFH